MSRRIKTDVKPFKIHITSTYTVYDKTAAEMLQMRRAAGDNPLCILKNPLLQSDQFIDPAQIDELRSISANWDWFSKCPSDKKIFIVREVAQKVKVSAL